MLGTGSKLFVQRASSNDARNGFGGTCFEQLSFEQSSFERSSSKRVLCNVLGGDFAADHMISVLTLRVGAAHVICNINIVANRGRQRSPDCGDFQLANRASVSDAKRLI
jgi:hypothetical protein